jgi:hypothetical protein
MVNAEERATVSDHDDLIREMAKQVQPAEFHAEDYVFGTLDYFPSKPA